MRPIVTPAPSRFTMPDPADGRPGVDLVALGADLEPGTLLAAYGSGLFPMPIDPDKKRSKLAWYSPDPRGVLPLDELKVSKSLRAQQAQVRRHDERSVRLGHHRVRRPGA